VEPDDRGLPQVNAEALREIFRVWGDQILSPLYVGWTQGFHDSQRARLEATLKEINPPQGYHLGHPREAVGRIAADIAREENDSWLA
jgi:CRISPR-associated protein Cst2